MGARRTVTGPTGSWELYVSKLAPVRWRRGASYGPPPEFGGRTFGESLAVDEEIRRENHRRTSYAGALGRYALDFGRAVVRSRTSAAVHVEAINWEPPRERLHWTTTDAAVERVLDEIVDGLREGKVVQPVGAVYSGGSQDYPG